MKEGTEEKEEERREEEVGLEMEKGGSRREQGKTVQSRHSMAIPHSSTMYGGAALSGGMR